MVYRDAARLDRGTLTLLACGDQLQRCRCDALCNLEEESEYSKDHLVGRARERKKSNATCERGCASDRQSMKYDQAMQLQCKQAAIAPADFIVLPLYYII